MNSQQLCFNLSPGDDIAYIIPSSGNVRRYGRIISIHPASFDVLPYIESTPTFPLVPSLSLLPLRELAINSTAIAETVSKDWLNDIIYVVHFEKIKYISSSSFLGMNNFFFIRFQTDALTFTVLPSYETFPNLSFSSCIFQEIRYIRQNLIRIVNKRAMGQSGRASFPVSLKHNYWLYILWRLNLEPTTTRGTRPQKIIHNDLSKETSRLSVTKDHVLLNFDMENLRSIFKGVFGDLCLVGSRSKPPKVGEGRKEVQFGHYLNRVSMIQLTYIRELEMLSIRVKYTCIIVNDDFEP